MTAREKARTLAKRFFALVLGVITVPYFLIFLDAQFLFQNRTQTMIVLLSAMLTALIALAAFTSKKLPAEKNEDEETTSKSRARWLARILAPIEYVAWFLTGSILVGGLIINKAGSSLQSIWFRPALMLVAFLLVILFVIMTVARKSWRSAVFAAFFMIALVLLTLPFTVSRGVVEIAKATDADIKVAGLIIKPKNFLGLLTMTGEGRRTRRDGEVYEGSMTNGIPDGKGILTFANGNVYEGDFVHGFEDGEGTYTWENGTIYEGSFVKGEQTGTGKLTKYNGEVYEGDFVKGQRDGKGKILHSYNGTYEGDFLLDSPHGEGVWHYANGDVYEGSLETGRPHGKGKMAYSDGTVYEGDFAYSLPEGKGTYDYSNGDSYQGDSVNGDLHGKGLYKWANGDEYEGDFRQGWRTGFGKYTWASGDVFEGNLVNGTAEGQGTIRYTNGENHSGNFEDGKLITLCYVCGTVHTVAEVKPKGN